MDDLTVLIYLMNYTAPMNPNQNVQKNFSSAQMDIAFIILSIAITTPIAKMDLMNGTAGFPPSMFQPCLQDSAPRKTLTKPKTGQRPLFRDSDYKGFDDRKHCRNLDFPCEKDKICLPRAWLCDGDDDCDDGSDEMHCPFISFHSASTTVIPATTEQTCPDNYCMHGADCIVVEGEYICNCSPSFTGEKCERSISAELEFHDLGLVIGISMTLIIIFIIMALMLFCYFKRRSERHSTALRGKTESQMPIASIHCVLSVVQTACQRHQFRCDDGECIFVGRVCDGRNDCKDWSDETRCSDRNYPKCPKDYFQCLSDRRCIDYSWLCDDDEDCSDGSDEENCVSACGDYQFECLKNKQCIYIMKRCDGNVDCKDGSDERSCRAYNCPYLHFPCEKDPRCVPRAFICDGENDCDDGSDEMHCEYSSTSSTTINPTTTEPSCPDNYCTHGADCVVIEGEYYCIRSIRYSTALMSKNESQGPIASYSKE
ncbi:Low-density lipoprotein receptor 1 like protein [Argiope bruennichi]|uniref:Low-density lipoprotein receptor 1 like protein n=1 Tax=Argiope bruennichi TaxID=94029 RepID=A0A8T0ECV1_ARGBR|nr:Low-density lipoprotein receptor 1 like protein [Argiope bruennichi]